jgi:hypothetical protein
MSLKQWEDNGWLKPHRTSRKEIKNLLDIVEYEYVGGASGPDADELIEFVKDLRDEVIAWLKKKHPELL